MEILLALRSATGGVHRHIEDLPICHAMLDGRIEKDQYLDLLAALFHVHDQAEQKLSKLPGWPQTPSRAAAIARDLVALGGEIGEPPLWLNDWLDEIPSDVAWAGVGYVVEGSRMGSRVLVKSVSRAFGLPMEKGVGLDYHLDAGEDPNGTWRSVMAALGALDSPESRDEIVTAAVATFEALFHLHAMIGEPIGV